MCEPDPDPSKCINFNLCVLCQEEKKEQLKSTKNARGVFFGVGYETLSTNIIEFNKLSALPMKLHENLLFFSNNNDLKNLLTANKAIWHKSCYDKFGNKYLEKAKLRAAQSKTEPGSSHDSYFTRRSAADNCLFCEMPKSKLEPLSSVTNKSCSDNILSCAKKLNDLKVLGLVSETFDLTALAVKYHNKCYTAYKNKARTLESYKSESNNKAFSTAFAELVSHIYETREISDSGNPVFTVTELAEKLDKSLKDLGVDLEVSRQTLKEKLLEECPDLTSTSKPGMPTLITFKDGLDSSVRTLSNRTSCNEEVTLCEAAKIVRSDIENNRDDNKNITVPASLISLISMIINGPPSGTPRSDTDNVAKNLAELVTFHFVSRKKNSKRRHSKGNETAVPIYLAAKLYSATRKRNLIDCTFPLGMSISYQRLQAIISEKANAVCELYHRQKVVCPPNLLKSLFTTASVDNIDHNPTATFAATAFHGTAIITLMQHKMQDEAGIPREVENLSLPSLSTNEPENHKQMELPPDYSIVPPCFVDVKTADCNKTTITSHNQNHAPPFFGEKDWLESASGSLKTWESYHSSTPSKCQHATKIALLPIFREHSNTAAMMMHTIDVVSKAIDFINPGQKPVIVGDQPLYALLKQLLYLFPEKRNVFVMMGGLHIEMAVLKMIGQLLDGSGWTQALVKANVITPGRSEALLTASNVTRARYAHQVTAVSLYSLQMEAYNKENLSIEHQELCRPFEEWKSFKLENRPQFKYWDMILQLELCMLQFIRSNRTGDFELYKDFLRQLVPWFFALDHVNYARWLSVHIRDLANMDETHPNLLEQFKDGKFVAKKSDCSFSGIALDQAHEQVNAFMKGDGGMIGITEDANKLRKWLIGGPELAAMVEDFEKKNMRQTDSTVDPQSSKHHLDKESHLKKFSEAVSSLKATLIDLGSPFLEDSGDLFDIDSKIVASSDVVKSIQNIEKLGEEQYLCFCRERLHGNKPLHDAIKLNKLPLLSSPSTRLAKNKDKNKTAALKNDCQLFSKLYIATSEHRAGDLDQFFSHENQSSPPALALAGTMRSGTKSDLLGCLTGIPSTTNTPNPPEITAKILDGPAIVHMLTPGLSQTFGEYADNVFVPFIKRELGNVTRLDLVWDIYQSDSLKNVTREKRGTGQRTKVDSNTRIPKSWANFLRVDSNKEELFELLTLRCISIDFDEGKEFNVTQKSSVLSNISRDKKNLEPCNHEEADTRMLLHVADAAHRGHGSIMIRTVDTDVVVIAISCVQKLPELKELWVHMGTGKHHTYISCHAIATALGSDRAEVLPVFHALTGCDTVSAFHGRGKKSAFDAWCAYPEATRGFKTLFDENLAEADSFIQKFIITMYDRSSPCTTVNECRKYLFTKKDRQLENIPPTEAALRQHTLRAMYQGVHVWGQALTPYQNLLCPSSWGWRREEDVWVPRWSDLPDVATVCLELTRCRCKKSCKNRCNCIKRNLKCTELCFCAGLCTQ